FDERTVAHVVGEERQLGAAGQRCPRLAGACRALVVVEHRDAQHHDGKCGSVIDELRRTSWNTRWSAARIVVAVACGSPAPRLRAYTGCAPPDTCTRMRCPAPKRWPAGHSATVTANT